MGLSAIRFVEGVLGEGRSHDQSIALSIDLAANPSIISIEWEGRSPPEEPLTDRFSVDKF